MTPLAHGLNMNNSARWLTVNPDGQQWIYLTPGDLRRTDIAWLGTVTRGNGDTGALGRLKSTGALVQVGAGVTRTLDQRKAEAALSEALTGERRVDQT